MPLSTGAFPYVKDGSSTESCEILWLVDPLARTTQYQSLQGAQVPNVFHIGAGAATVSSCLSSFLQSDSRTKFHSRMTN